MDSDDTADGVYCYEKIMDHQVEPEYLILSWDSEMIN